MRTAESPLPGLPLAQRIPRRSFQRFPADFRNVFRSEASSGFQRTTGFTGGRLFFFGGVNDTRQLDPQSQGKQPPQKDKKLV
jgi:hypothetical protein